MWDTHPIHASLKKINLKLYFLTLCHFTRAGEVLASCLNMQTTNLYSSNAAVCLLLSTTEQNVFIKMSLN